MNRLSTAIRKKRKTLNLTQAQLAEGIISVPYLSLIENGKATPGNEILTLLAERLQTNSDQLLGISDQKIIAKIKETLHMVHHDLLQTRFAAAMQKIKHCRELAEPLGDLQQLMEIELTEIQCYLHDWQTSSDAFTLLDEFEQQWELSLEGNGIIEKFLCTKGYAEMRQFRFKQAFQYFKEAEKYFSSSDCPFTPIRICQGLASSSIFLNKSSLSIAYLQKMRKLALQNNQPLNLVICYLKLGDAYYYSGETEYAITYLQKIINLKHQLVIPSLYLYCTYSKLATCYLDQLRLNEASDLLETTFETLKSQENSPFEFAKIEKQMGLLALKKNQITEARHFLETARKSLQNHPLELAECHIYLGQLEYVSGNYHAFQNHYQEALNQYESIDLHSRAASVASTLAEFHLEHNQERAAIQYLVKASRYAQTSISGSHFIGKLPDRFDFGG